MGLFTKNPSPYSPETQQAMKDHAAGQQTSTDNSVGQNTQAVSSGQTSPNYNYSTDDPYSPYYDPDKEKRQTQEKADRDLAEEYSGGPMGVTKSGVPSTAIPNKKWKANRPRWDSQWKAFTFEYFYNKYMSAITLFVNPESFTQTEPARVTVTQTKGGMFVDHFGPGVKTIAISGTTGYKQRDTTSKFSSGTMVGKESGQEHFLNLRKMYRDWLTNATDPINPAIMRFHNWSDEESYEVAINQFTLQRTTSRPLLYQYNIQMTVIKSVDAKDMITEPDITDTIKDKSRVNLANNSLKESLGFFGTLSAGMTNISDSMKSFRESLTKGTLKFFDTAYGVYRSADSIIEEVQNLSNDLEMVVNGAATFVSTPLDLVTSLITSIEDLCDNLSSVSNIPHEAVRSFRDMQCAISALPESLFKGFTNPDLFDGASNCGTTLGISDAPVSAYANSFTATAQLPSLRKGTQRFAIPVRTILLKEIPIQVTGVYVSTDIEYTGINYLDSWSGNQVTLTDIPVVPVTVVYSVQQATTQGMVQFETASAYVVQTGDILPRLALNFYGDALQWKRIALYNDLDYPYVTDDIDFEHEIHATGTIRFYRQTGYSTAVTIPLGTRVYVPASSGGTKAIYFETTKLDILTISNSYIDIPVEARSYGDIGNVAPNIVTGFGVVENGGVYYKCIVAHTASEDNEPGVGDDEATYWAVDAIRTGAKWTSGSYYPIAPTGIGSVNNLAPILGGKDWKVASAGDIIFIPQVTGQKLPAVISSGQNYDELFGIDIKLNVDGEISEEKANDTDLERISGVNNLSQALRNRLKTSRAFYPYNSTYGTNIPLYIGQRGTYFWFTRLEKEVVDTMLDDDRLKEVRGLKMILNGDLIVIDFNAVTIATQSNLPVNVVV